MSYEITLFSNVNTSSNNIDDNITSNENQFEKTNSTNNFSNKNSITIFLCLNGADKNHIFPLKIEDYKQKTLRNLKDQISKYLTSSNIYKNQNKTFTIHSLFTLNEILINDYDIQYLTENEILFFTLNSGEQFNAANHYNIYDFHAFINSGGYAKVFIANNIITNKTFAIKCIEINNFSQEELYNISREQLILHSLNHTNIIKVYDSFQYNNKFYTVMDYCKGGELNTYLKEKKILSEKESKNIFKQIYNAVKYIHSQNIIHRDLKPNNILFKDEQRKNVVLIDFGISGYKNGKNFDKIKAGTFRFVPPEILDGNFESNAKLDIWSLGLILYRMVFGKFPFEGKNDEEIGWKILNEKIDFDVVDNKKKKIVCSREIKDLLNGMLEKNYKFRIDDDCDLFEKWFDANDDEIFIKSVNSVKNQSYNNPFDIESKNKRKKRNAYLSPSFHNKLVKQYKLKGFKNNDNNNFDDNIFINGNNKNKYSTIDENSNKKNFLPIINNFYNNNIKKIHSPKKEKLSFLNHSNSQNKKKRFSAEKIYNNKFNEIFYNDNNNNNNDKKTKLIKLNTANKNKKSLFSNNLLKKLS